MNWAAMAVRVDTWVSAQNAVALIVRRCTRDAIDAVMRCGEVHCRGWLHKFRDCLLYNYWSTSLNAGVA